MGADDEQAPAPEWPYDADGLRKLALEVARRILAWDGYDPPRAYSNRLPVSEALPEGHDGLPPVRVDTERFQPEPERLEARIGIWRLIAECSVEHMTEDGARLAWRNRTEALHCGEPAIDEAEATRVAEALVGALPRGARGPFVKQTGEGDDEQVFEVSWAHFDPEGLLVDGDKLLVRINAATGRPYTLFRKWRTAPSERAGAPTPPPPAAAAPRA